MRLEKLLNTLIQKWWKPFGKKPVDIKEYCGWERYTKYFDFYNIRINREDTICERPRVTDNYSLRDIVSRESGLWQFVCGNGMISKPTKQFYWQNIFQLDSIEYDQYDYQYRVIESSLKDESELESFILDNIKV